MNKAETPARLAVGAGEHPAGHEYPRRFGEELVLRGAGRKVVQHREADHGAERRGAEGHAGGVAVHHGHRLAELGTQPAGELRIGFECRQRCRPLGERLGAGTVSRTELKHVIAKRHAVECARHQGVRHKGSPFGGAAEPLVIPVQRVHSVLSVPVA